jgi:hypothetical protein
VLTVTWSKPSHPASLYLSTILLLMTLSLMTLTYQNSTLRRIIPDTLDQLPWLRGHWEISCLLLLLHVLLLLPAFYMPERTTTFADTCLRLSRGMLTQRMNVSSRRANDALLDLGSCIWYFLYLLGFYSTVTNNLSTLYHSRTTLESQPTPSKVFFLTNDDADTIWR